MSTLWFCKVGEPNVLVLTNSVGSIWNVPPCTDGTPKVLVFVCLVGWMAPLTIGVPKVLVFVCLVAVRFVAGGFAWRMPHIVVWTPPAGAALRVVVMTKEDDADGDVAAYPATQQSSVVDPVSNRSVNVNDGLAVVDVQVIDDPDSQPSITNTMSPVLTFMLGDVCVALALKNPLLSTKGSAEPRITRTPQRLTSEADAV